MTIAGLNDAIDSFNPTDRIKVKRSSAFFLKGLVEHYQPRVPIISVFGHRIKLKFKTFDLKVQAKTTGNPVVFAYQCVEFRGIFSSSIVTSS
ncbi:hypothetical protein DFO70_1435 [Cytobacillus firmus]|uniref:Uncharacterized protein n=2 Tax=Cytobacillus TaxID=2675230 RepID=A0A366JG77_CYTFI|nr:hypothetical protein DFO70_1435 [Cytobacillus firmus]TDX35959.1 hypothetical protein DFO72_12317 [Cytobacillus oceanisediminis]